MKKLCDFCTSRCLLPTLLRFRPFIEVYPGSREVSADDGQWFACAACLALVEAKDVDGLVRRHMANAPFSEQELVLGTGEGSAIERASQQFKYMQSLLGMLLANRIC